MGRRNGCRSDVCPRGAWDTGCRPAACVYTTLASISLFHVAQTERIANDVRYVDLSTMHVSTIAGTGVDGCADGKGFNASFWSPMAIAVDGRGRFALLVSEAASLPSATRPRAVPRPLPPLYLVRQLQSHHSSGGSAVWRSQNRGRPKTIVWLCGRLRIRCTVHESSCHGQRGATVYRLYYH